jgi:hypothetical protein
MAKVQTVKLGNSEYVIVPKADYLRVQRSAGIPAGSVDAANTLADLLLGL